MKLVLDHIGLRKGKNEVLKDISLRWEEPGCYLVTGPKGAGKSSLLKVMTGTVSCNQGEVYLDEGAGIGYVPQKYGIYPGMTPVDFFDYLLLLEGYTDRRQRARMVQTLIIRAEIEKWANKRIGTLPLSCRQKIAVVQSLIGKPTYIFFDAPEQNLSGSSLEWLLSFLSQLKREHMVVVSSQRHDVFEHITDRVAILYNGELLFEGVTDKLVKAVEGLVLEGVVSFRQWQSFSVRHKILSSEIVNGGILVRVLGEIGESQFVPVEAGWTEAVEAIIERRARMAL